MSSNEEMDPTWFHRNKEDPILDAAKECIHVVIGLLIVLINNLEHPQPDMDKCLELIAKAKRALACLDTIK